MSDDSLESDQKALREKLEKLKQDHHHIDSEISALVETGVADALKVQRMKKIKLSIKDQISHLENQITPDIIA